MFDEKNEEDDRTNEEVEMNTSSINALADEPSAGDSSNLENNASMPSCHQKLEAKRKEIENLKETIVT